jgi:hypothetical protein
MQIMLTSIVYYIAYYGEMALEDDHGKEKNIIMYFLFTEHCFSYVVAFYRAWDIDTNGSMDINGIKRAPMESLLGNF